MKGIKLINSFSDSSPCSQIKNISWIYLHQTIDFFLTLRKIFSSKALLHMVEQTLPIAVPWVCKFYQKIQQCYSLTQAQKVLSEYLFWTVFQSYYPIDPLEKQDLHHIGCLDKDQQNQCAENCPLQKMN